MLALCRCSRYQCSPAKDTRSDLLWRSWPLAWIYLFLLLLCVMRLIIRDRIFSCHSIHYAMPKERNTRAAPRRFLSWAWWMNRWIGSNDNSSAILSDTAGVVGIDYYAHMSPFISITRRSTFKIIFIATGKKSFSILTFPKNSEQQFNGMKNHKPRSPKLLTGQLVVGNSMSFRFHSVQFTEIRGVSCIVFLSRWPDRKRQRS